jgi:hypothetical protein
MNCATIQRSLLSCERPDQPPVELRRHLAECDACRALQRRLVQLEEQLPLLPVPPSSGREAFLQRIRAGDAVADPAAGPTIWLQGKPLKERGLQKLALALAMAAALAVFALGWWAWPHQGTVSRNVAVDGVKARQQHRDQLLAAARTPRERVEILADLAGRLNQEAGQLAQAAKGEQLKVVAQFYREVVRKDLLEHARQLSQEERPAVLNQVAASMTTFESEAARLATEVAEANAVPLRDIALASRECSSQLRSLLGPAVS